MFDFNQQTSDKIQNHDNEKDPGGKVTSDCLVLLSLL